MASQGSSNTDIDVGTVAKDSVSSPGGTLHSVAPANMAPLQIHDKCKVLWRGGIQSLSAVIIERRKRGCRKRKQSAEDLDSLKADEIEYYVHFVDHDRRLDEWVTLERVQLETLERYSTVEGTAKSTLHSDGVGASDPAVTAETDRQVRHRSMAKNGGVKAHTGNTASSSEGGTVVDHSSGHNNASASTNSNEHFSLSGGNWHGSSGDPALAEFEREHEETTKVKNIEKIIMGEWEVEAWYYSPFPDEYTGLSTLYVCEYCLAYMKKAKTYKKHRAECACRAPPGRQIYREDDIAVYELDGKDHKAYCQKLCLLAKLFLDHKTLFYDVTPFRFYLVCKVDSRGSHIVGYFSKEKTSSEGYNLACILTFPQFQQSGYGKFIISLSYELTKREGTTGSPEKPLSDLGKLSYRSYWTHVLMNLLNDHDTSQDISISDMCDKTGIRTEDIISTLQSLDMIKVWKGQHVVYVQQDVIQGYLEKSKPFRLCKSDFLTWEPPSRNVAAGKEVATTR